MPSGSPNVLRACAPPGDSTGVVLAGVTLALLLSSCSSSSELDLDELEIVEPGELVESAVFPGAWATPLEIAWYPDRERFDAVAELTSLAIEECMSERGFPDYVDRRETLPTAGYYGVIDPEVARVWGYMDPANVDLVVEDPNAPQAPMVDRPLTDEEIALVGTEEGRTETAEMEDGTIVDRYDPSACRNIGTLAVQPHHFELLALEFQLQEMSSDASFAVQDSPEFREAFDEWAACVASKGEVEPSFPDGLGGTIHSLPGETSAEEISEAVAHAECKHETGFLREWSRLRVEEERRLIEENPGPVTEYMELWNETFGTAG